MPFNLPYNLVGQYGFNPFLSPLDNPPSPPAFNRGIPEADEPPSVQSLMRRDPQQSTYNALLRRRRQLGRGEMQPRGFNMFLPATHEQGGGGY